MKIAMIAAVAENNAIGIDNKLPWYLPGDLRYFKAVTMGKPIIMGRKTFESLKRPLPGRTNIVMTRDESFYHEGVRVVRSLEEAVSLAESIAMIDGASEVMVIGGEQIYRQALPKAERLYLTKVSQSFAGDAFFPALEETEWQEKAREDHETDEGLKYSYQVMDRV
ncbi:dihydrofolate reductase [Sansalvadorimonas sp. 2012CJ34-2]|uniref:Dihydrofolate reductase n=1 Tax=Parendozoicomonas callyspongiae TaxID=2942213 RepID=A0ABT0PCW7_9GAMM|nr:dihydrofolate reductase [Sansalvadorimonas sp. 2012CJ34-2]MCL6269225.1 dihydrofolate reductase [Sansalvadorimonas sp. 2012CJ34-2]